MKRPIAIIAGFLIVPACGVVAVLTAQERYNSSSNNQKRTAGFAQVAGGPLPVPGYAAPAYPAPQAPNRTGGQLYYADALAEFDNSFKQFHSPVHESAQLVQQAQQGLATAGNEEERERAKASLRKALNLQFDADMEQREKELAGIRERLTEMTRLLEKRSAAKEQIVDLRLQVLAQDADGLGWASAVGKWPGNAGPGPGVPLPNLPPPNYGYSPYSTPGTAFNTLAAPAPPHMPMPTVVNGSNLEPMLPPGFPGPGTALPGPVPARAPRPNSPASEPNAFQKNNDPRSEQPLFSADEEPGRSENYRSSDNDDAE